MEADPMKEERSKLPPPTPPALTHHKKLTAQHKRWAKHATLIESQQIQQREFEADARRAADPNNKLYAALSALFEMVDENDEADVERGLPWLRALGTIADMASRSREEQGSLIDETLKAWRETGDSRVKWRKRRLEYLDLLNLDKSTRKNRASRDASWR